MPVAVHYLTPVGWRHKTNLWPKATKCLSRESAPLLPSPLRVYLKPLAGLLLLPTLALADLPSFEPEPGQHAQVQQHGERYFLQQPDGSRLALSIPEGNDAEAPSFAVEDYDFDGHPDLAISVPAGTTHRFDMGSEPEFTAIRLFNNAEGWVANFTGSDIASRFPLLP